MYLSFYSYRVLLKKGQNHPKNGIVQTGGSYSIKHTSLFNHFDFNIDMNLTSSLWVCISIMP